MAIIAAWAIVTGVFEIAAAIRLRRIIQGEWLLALSGVLSLLLGALLILSPLAGAIAIAVWFGAFAFASGIVLMILGFRLRNWLKSEQRIPRAA